MTRDQYISRYVWPNGWLAPGAPIYLEEDKEAERLAWIKWWDRLIDFLFALRLQSGGSTDLANRLMTRFWPFPNGSTYRAKQ